MAEGVPVSAFTGQVKEVQLAQRLCVIIWEDHNNSSLTQLLARPHEYKTVAASQDTLGGQEWAMIHRSEAWHQEGP